jgi:hypothetical protein
MSLTLPLKTALPPSPNLQTHPFSRSISPLLDIGSVLCAYICYTLCRHEGPWADITRITHYRRIINIWCNRFLPFCLLGT